jgi:lipopolysaccharide/colanic/teichoic acid biosynthesis glycosyltransferase
MLKQNRKNQVKLHTQKFLEYYFKKFPQKKLLVEDLTNSDLSTFNKKQVKLQPDIIIFQKNLETSFLYPTLTLINQSLKTGGLLIGATKVFENHSLLNYFFNPALSKTELIGYLVHAGFKILEDHDFNSHFWFVAQKITPSGNEEKIEKAKKIFFLQSRVGKNGKKIKIFKLRTMYPLAYLAQEYLYKNQTFGRLGKPQNDFRITPLGKILRRYWIDELPQILNFLKGDITFIGVRPLTEGFFKVLPKNLQEERLKIKPGLIPQCYADRPKNLSQRIASEKKYLEARKKNPFLTNLSYLLRTLLAILTGERGH